jgi:hypothetical protein
MNTVISYPIPPYSNPPINPQYYQPSRFVISGVTRGTITTITTTQNMNYVIGQLIRLVIPPSFGIRELNGQTAFVLSIPNLNQVVINIDSTSYSAFTNSNATTQAQILGIGDINNGYISNTGNVISNPEIPGSFINISPL